MSYFNAHTHASKRAGIGLTCLTAGAMLLATACSGANLGSALNVPVNQPDVGPNNPSPSASPMVSTTLTYYHDIKPIMDGKCANCHVAGGIAPFTLLSYGDANDHRATILADVTAGTMPPWMPGPGCNTYDGDFSLTAQEQQNIITWLQAGAPAGDPDTAVAAVAQPAYGLPRVDASLTLAQPYQVQQSPDEYRCFILSWPYTTTKYVTGFSVEPGNASIVHHAIAYLVPAANASQVTSQDGADGHPGFPCTGGVPGSSGGWLGAWAPGSVGGLWTPSEDTGIEVDANTLVVLQVHYHVVGSAASAAPDQSRITVTVKDSVAKPGTQVPFTDPLWLAGGMPIAANDANVIHNWTYSASSYMGYMGLTGNLAIYSVGLHMHVRGKSGILSLQHADKSNTCLVQIPKWNFNWQNGYRFPTPVALKADDSIFLQCQWDNSAANQPVINGVRSIPANINWGEGTNDEMCLGVMYVAPQ